MLYFCYHFDYDDQRHGDDQISALIHNVNMVQIAEKYFVEPLKKLAREKFQTCAYAQWDQAAFGESIALIYDSDSPSVSTLKPAVMDTVRKHSDVLFTDTAYSAFQQSIRDAPDFLLDWAKDVATIVHDKKDLPTADAIWYKCPGNACSNYGVAFCVNGSVPAHWSFSCPLRCTRDKDRAYWKQHLLQQ